MVPSFSAWQHSTPVCICSLVQNGVQSKLPVSNKYISAVNTDFQDHNATVRSKKQSPEAKHCLHPDVAGKTSMAHCKLRVLSCHRCRSASHALAHLVPDSDSADQCVVPTSFPCVCFGRYVDAAKPLCCRRDTSYDSYDALADGLRAVSERSRKGEAAGNDS